MEALFAEFVPDYAQAVQALAVALGGFFAGGVLIAFLAWVTGYAVHGVYSWLDSWSR